jgi:hypothetical protein
MKAQSTNPFTLPSLSLDDWPARTGLTTDFRLRLRLRLRLSLRLSLRLRLRLSLFTTDFRLRLRLMLIELR